MTFSRKQIEEIKSNLRKILLYYGLGENGNGNWTCLKSRHETPQNSLSVKNNICCCSCGFGGDALSIIAELEGLNIRSDFQKILKKGIEIIGMQIDNYIAEEKKYIKRNDDKEYIKNLIDNIDLTKIIVDTFKDINDYSYYNNRGIDFNIIQKYKLLHKNPLNIFPKNILPNVRNIYAYQNIIPVWKNSKVVNCILRRDDKLSLSNTKILNLKHYKLELFNIDQLKKISINDFLFICEGVFDSLTYEQIGYKSMCLNSVSMKNKFLQLIKEYRNNIISRNLRIILSFDNDKAGIETTNYLKIKLSDLNIKNYVFKFRKFKDVNEFYCNDSNEFIKCFNRAIKIINNKSKDNKILGGIYERY